jgi:hypothetical protein
MITFRSIFQSLGPGWLTEADGGKVLYSVGVLLDATLERMRQALHARLPEYTETEDSLAYIGRDRLIIRGRNESAAAYARRLVQWRYPLGHRVRGNALGMLRQVRAYFDEELVQFTVDRRGTWFKILADGTESYDFDTGLFAGGDDLPADPNWARFWLGLSAPASWEFPQVLIGDPELWGGTIEENSEYVIGIDGATQADMQALRVIARDWKMAGSKQEYALIVLDSTNLDNLPGYLTLVTTSWFGQGGDEVAFNNAQTVPVRLLT